VTSCKVVLERRCFILDPRPQGNTRSRCLRRDLILARSMFISRSCLQRWWRFECLAAHLKKQLHRRDPREPRRGGDPAEDRRREHGSRASCPLSISRCRAMSLYNSRLSGRVPAGISGLVGLQKLLLAGNRFSGKLPPLSTGPPPALHVRSALRRRRGLPPHRDALPTPQQPCLPPLEPHRAGRVRQRRSAWPRAQRTGASAPADAAAAPRTTTGCSPSREAPPPPPSSVCG
jgi:hypothetical protein